MFCTTKSAIAAFSMLTLGFSIPGTSSTPLSPLQESVAPVTVTVASTIDPRTRTRLASAPLGLPVPSAQPVLLPAVKPTLEMGLPAPQSPLILSGDSPTLEDVVHAFEASVQAIVLKSDDVCAQAASRRLRFSPDLVVPTGEVYEFFESLLMQNGYCLSFLKGGAVPLLSMRSNRNNSDMGFRYTDVNDADLSILERHPALLVSMSFDLKNAEARQMSNTLRSVLANGPNLAIATGERTINLRGTAAGVALIGRIIRQSDAATPPPIVQQVMTPSGINSK